MKAIVIVTGMLLAMLPLGFAAAPSTDAGAGPERAASASRPVQTVLRRRDAQPLSVGVVMLKGLNQQDPPADAPDAVRRSPLKGVAIRWPAELPSEAGNRPLKIDLAEVGKDVPQFGGFDVLVLMPMWAHYAETTAALDVHTDAFHEYVKNGGGLIVCQPNPVDNYPSDEIAKEFSARNLKPNGYCAPKLLPLPATFYNWYVGETVKKTEAVHPLTTELTDRHIPFPADQILKLDKAYTVLARGQTSETPALAVACFGQGRIVLLPGNVQDRQGVKQNPPKNVVDRSILWASRCSDEEVSAVNTGVAP